MVQIQQLAVDGVLLYAISQTWKTLPLQLLWLQSKFAKLLIFFWSFQGVLDAPIFKEFTIKWIIKHIFIFLLWMKALRLDTQKLSSSF